MAGQLIFMEPRYNLYTHVSVLNIATTINYARHKFCTVYTHGHASDAMPAVYPDFNSITNVRSVKIVIATKNDDSNLGRMCITSSDGSAGRMSPTVLHLHVSVLYLLILRQIVGHLAAMYFNIVKDMYMFVLQMIVEVVDVSVHHI